VEISLWAWVAVVAVILGALALDLLVFHRNPHEVSVREAALTSAGWAGLALVFGVVVWFALGAGRAGEYATGYLIEKSLSVDNVFVIALILGSFAVPKANHHRVLFWGVLGALGMRAVLILVGGQLLESFHWVLYGFGALLIVSGIRMARHQDGHVPSAARRLRHGRLAARPMVAAIIAVESVDLVFAVDSIPAVYAVTEEPFLVFASNAFALLGMRALYFVLADAMGRFPYLKFGLATILVFVGAKMLVTDLVHVPVWASLLVIAGVLAASVALSWRRTSSVGAWPVRSS
jgi:tellurite resistance protein TerC